MLHEELIETGLRTEQLLRGESESCQLVFDNAGGQSLLNSAMIETARGLRTGQLLRGGV